MPKPVTRETILRTMREWVEAKIPIPPDKWLDSAAKLNVLLEDLDDELLDAKMRVAEEKALLIQHDNSVNKSDALVQASPHYREFLRLKAERSRIEEHIRIAKKRTELDSWSV